MNNISHKKPTVLLASNTFYPFVGGVENSLYFLAQSYQQLGFEVIIFVSDVGPNSNILPHDELIDGIQVVRHASHAKIFCLFRPFRMLLTTISAVKKLKHIKRHYQIAFTVSRFHTSTLYCYLAGLSKISYLVPGIVHFQNSTKNFVKRSGFAKIKALIAKFIHHNTQKFALKKCNHIIVFSENMVKQINSILQKKPTISIVKPGVDTNKFKPVTEIEKNKLRNKHHIPTSKTLLLTVGRFVQAKGFELVVEAMQHLSNCHLVMVGDGETMENIKSQIRHLQLEDQVSLIGSQSDCVPFYQMADIFVMSSKYEPLGQTILEALASGLPIVAFSNSTVNTATHELLHSTEYQICDDFSALSLATSISKLAADKHKQAQLANSGRLIAQNKYSWDVLAKQLISISKNDVCF